MNSVTLTVVKTKVYEEVAKTTSYTGAKMTEDESAYNRIFTTDADQTMLERFWVEACNGATEQLKPFITTVNSHIIGDANDYTVELELSGSYDTSLTDSMKTSLFSYFVAYIVAKWYKFTNKAESESYGVDAVGALDDVMKKVYYRKKPTRTIPK